MTVEEIRELTERLATAADVAEQIGSYAADLRAVVQRQPTLKARGLPTECQLAAWFFVQTVDESLNPKLVHGLVRLDPTSEPFFHAWVEIENACIDLTQFPNRWVMHRDHFYAHVVDGATSSYTPTDALLNCLKSKEYGPWDERLKDQRFFPHLRKLK